MGSSQAGLASLPRRNPKVQEAPLQGEMMLFDPERSKFFVLNRTMALVWRHCDGQHSIADAVESLCEEFTGVDMARAEADLRRAVEELLSMDLLRGSGA